MLDDRDQIEEAHGLWELEAARVCTLMEAMAQGCNVPQKLINEAVATERAAFRHWQALSNEVTGRHVK